MDPAQRWMTCLAQSSLPLVALLLMACDGSGPQSGLQRMQQELATSCSYQNTSVSRLTKNPAASTEPAIAALRDGHVLAWVDDRTIPAEIFVQRLNPLGAAVGQPTRLTTGGGVHRPRVASDGADVAVVYLEERPEALGEVSVMLQVLGEGLRPRLATARALGITDLSHGAGLVYIQGRYTVGYSHEGALHLQELTVRHLESQTVDGGSAEADAAAGTTSAELIVTSREILFDQGMPEPGNIDLTFQGENLYFAADHPEGWSILIAEVGRDTVRRLVQVIDDRRHPEARWCCPALAPVGAQNIQLLWQGPSMGLASLFFMEFGPEGAPVGRERPFEAWVRDEEERPIGRAPAFHPAMATTPQGLVAVFADNRYSNTEILMASFDCGGQTP